MAFQILGRTIGRGERVEFSVEIGRLYDATPIYTPIEVWAGRESGPQLLLTSTLHGDEIAGVEIIRRVLRSKRLREFRGTLICAPLINVFGFTQKSRFLPDQKDLNRAFPGNANGSIGEQIAWMMERELLARATHVIDLHTGSLRRPNFPQIRASLSTPANLKLARAFGAPVILGSKQIAGSFRAAADQAGVPMLVYEAGEALRFDEAAIRTGVRGILNVMEELKMLPRHGERSSVRPMVAKNSYWVRALDGGILRLQQRLGATVAEGAVVGEIWDPLGKRRVELRAREAGVIVGQSSLPLVNRGDAVIHIATFKDLAPVTESLSDFRAFVSDDELVRLAD